MGVPTPAELGPDYRERLVVPPGWWVLGVLFCLSLGFAAGWYLGVAAAVVGGVVPMAVLAGFFLAYGAAVIAVDEHELIAGRAHIELKWVASVTALTPAETRIRRGPRADTKAYLLLRPYLPAAVEVTLDDPADPAPYWLLSTRRPLRLTGQLDRALALAGSGNPGPIGLRE